MIRFEFPDDFLWGTATSSFQIEGGADEGGRGSSMWDTACRAHSERFWGGATPSVSADFFHRYPEDVAMMKELGLKSFRLSISWSRIFPSGRGPINEEGLEFYDRLINALIAHGIEPLVDLYHWDLPQALAEDGGFKNPRIIEDFGLYAEVCFKRYGDRVRLWSTMNEPSVMAFTAYSAGHYPPFEADTRSALLAAQNIIRMHYRAVKTYRDLGQKGKIGAVIAFVPMYPRTLSMADRKAALRQEDYVCNWWLDPMFKGHYPESILSYPAIADFMPAGFAEQLAEEFEPMDMVGINYYTPACVGHKEGTPLESEQVEHFYAQTDYGFHVYPQGLFDSMMYLKEKYNDPEIYITENGFSHDTEKPDATVFNDEDRINYIREHLREVARSIKAGVNIKGYYYWAHFDDFEATSGYRFRFGLVHVDFETLERTPKQSWHYFQNCIAHNAVD